MSGRGRRAALPPGGHARPDEVIGNYVADFAYWQVDPGRPILGDSLIVEDAKGVRTELYKWKKRHFELEYGLKISEV